MEFKINLHLDFNSSKIQKDLFNEVIIMFNKLIHGVFNCEVMLLWPSSNVKNVVRNTS